MTQLVRMRVSAAAAGVAVTGVLWSAGLLRGAAVTGQALPALDAALLPLLGAGIGVILAARRALSS